MIPIVALVMLLGHPGDAPYSHSCTDCSHRGKGPIAYEQPRCPKIVPTAWKWSPYDFSGSHGGAPHAFGHVGGHGPGAPGIGH